MPFKFQMILGFQIVKSDHERRTRVVARSNQATKR